MSSDKIFEIPIPSDNDGFVVLKCPICSEKFMIQVQDVNDDSLIDVWCPKCGLKSDNYLSTTSPSTGSPSAGFSDDPAESACPALDAD